MSQHIKLVVMLFATTLLSVNSFSETNDKNLIKIVFTHKMKLDDLMKIKGTLLKKNIQLDFIQTRFDSSGYLTALQFKVDCNDGFHGEASNPNFIHFTKRFGFYRDYGKKAKSPFGVGFI